MSSFAPKAAHSYKRAPYAQKWEETRGRLEAEPDTKDRTPFQRDRDRILCSEAFRRLQYKRQVFMNTEEGDFRTRLTHTLEVAQLTRSICRSLKLDEDLGECCALAHDIGHPPFGHAGEDALNDCMAKFGGFNHNVQAMRILRKLEQTYASFDGLNLTWEVVEGIAKHNGPIEKQWRKLEFFADLEPKTQSCLESQAAAEADQITYLHHDLDDGLSTGRLHLSDVMQVPTFRTMWGQVQAMFPEAEAARLVKETIRRMKTANIEDLLETSLANITAAEIRTVADVRQQKEMLITLSPAAQEGNKELYAFLMQHLYRHTRVNRFNFQAHRMVRDLFSAFMRHRKMLPEQWREKLPTDAKDEAGKARVVCDYIASLTDRSATREHARLFAPMVMD